MEKTISDYLFWNDVLRDIKYRQTGKIPSQKEIERSFTYKKLIKRGKA